MRDVAESFLRQLDGAEHALDLLDSLRDFGGSRATLSLGRYRSGRKAAAVQEELRAERDWEIIFLDGCVLYLAAQFEANIRDQAEALAARIAGAARRYDELPASIRTHNMELVGELLIGRHRTNQVEPPGVIQQLATCLARGRPVRLYLAGFSWHDRNLSGEQLAEIFRRLDVKDLWRGVGSDHALASYLGASLPEAVTQLARNKLDQFVQVRNQIAHRGPNYETAGSTEVRDYVQFLRRLATALAAVLEAHLRRVSGDIRRTRRASMPPNPR